eukprot:gene23789-23839_t
MLPFQVNNDPLNTVEGNPALRQSFSNTVAARFNDFKILQSRFLWANWNAYVEKKFLKKSQLAARFSVFDILNQNLGFSRNASGNIITQNSYSTIRRYAMLN